MTTRGELLASLQEAIEPIYGRREAALIARMVVAERGGISESALLVEPDLALEIADFESMKLALREGRPVQYVLGHTEFCGLDIHVHEGCLIPRPETEELIFRIRQSGENPHRLLDVGTGSGAIALALKAAFPACEVVAVDLSEEALAIARENSRRLNLSVEFLRADAFDLSASLTGTFDLIVSNPPYIPQSEEAIMRPNVTHYEPHEALFVPDEDPLCFYRAIARASRTLLSSAGSLWFEIHEDFADPMQQMLREEGFGEQMLYCDLNDKPRMLWSRR